MFLLVTVLKYFILTDEVQNIHSKEGVSLSKWCGVSLLKVSALEQELERARTSLEEEVRRRETEAQENNRDIREKNRLTEQLSESVT